MSTNDDQQRDEDVRKWVQEWKTWLGVSLILAGVWGVMSFRAGELLHFWPMYAIAIYAVVILVAPLFPRDSRPTDR